MIEITQNNILDLLLNDNKLRDIIGVRMKQSIFQIIIILTAQICFAQYSSVDTLYYPNQQIERIIMKLEGDSITIQKRYYAQHLEFKNGVFQLGEKKENKIESVETFVKWGNSVLMQEGYSEYFYENGNRKLEVIYSRNKGNRYINQWQENSTQLLKSGNGIYTELDFGLNGIDSIVYEVKDSLFNGQATRYKKNEAGKYYIRNIQYFKENKPVGVKSTYNLHGTIFIEERYFNNPDSVLFNMYYPNGQIKQSGVYYKERKYGNWKYYFESGQIKKEIEY